MQLKLLFFYVVVAMTSAQHVWNIVTSTNQLETQCELASVFETSFSFVDKFGNPIRNFSVTSSVTFGLVLQPDATFNLLYSIACMVISSCVSAPCPRTVFIVGAEGPGNPIVDIIVYRNSSGAWNVSATGDMQFFVA